MSWNMSRHILGCWFSINTTGGGLPAEPAAIPSSLHGNLGFYSASSLQTLTQLFIVHFCETRSQSRGRDDIRVYVLQTAPARIYASAFGKGCVFHFSVKTLINVLACVESQETVWQENYIEKNYTVASWEGKSITGGLGRNIWTARH